MRVATLLAVGLTALLLLWAFVPDAERSGSTEGAEDSAAESRDASQPGDADEASRRRSRHVVVSDEPAAPAGPVTVPGVVIGIDRGPVESGVRVVARRDGSPSPDSSPDADQPVTHVDADGTFELELPTRGVWRVRARAEDGSAGSAWSTVALAEHPNAPVPALALLLRRNVRVVGRVTDDSGAAVPSARVRVAMAHDIVESGEGGWSSGEGETEVVSTTTDVEGRFETSVRVGSACWAHAISATGVAGPRVQRRSDLARDGLLDLGDVIAPGADGRSRWDLRVVEEAGSLDCDLSLWLLSWDRAHLEEHPQYDSELMGVTFRADDPGVDLDLPVRERPVVVAVGGPDHVAQTFRLDCSTEGTRVVELALARRRAAVVEVRGEAAREAETAGILEVVLRGLRSSRTCIDAQSGAEVPMPDLWSPARTPHPRIRPPSPAVALEHRFRLRGDRVTPLGEGRFRVVGDDQASLRLAVRVGQQIVGGATIELGDPEASPETVIDLSGGRLLELDTSAVRAAVAESRISTALPGGFNVVPVVTAEDRTGRADGEDAAMEPIRPVPLLTTRTALADTPFRLWVPAGTSSLSFRGPDSTTGSPATIDVEVTSSDNPIPVPDPTPLLRRLGYVRCELRPSLRGVHPARPGVAVHVHNRHAHRDAPSVDLYVRSGSDGVAITWLPPGRYVASVAVDAGAVARDENAVEFDVASGDGGTSVTVPYSILRE